MPTHREASSGWLKAVMVPGACPHGRAGQKAARESPCSISGSGRSPEKGMATYSSILAWRIPWTDEPGRLHPWDCRVGHDRVTHTFTLSTQSLGCFIDYLQSKTTFHSRFLSWLLLVGRLYTGKAHNPLTRDRIQPPCIGSMES